MRNNPTNTPFINTVLLGGSTDQKIEAAGAAGFDEVEIWIADVDNHPESDIGVANSLRANAVRATDLQVLRDFDGAPDDAKPGKRAEALRLLDTASAIGAPMIMVAASTSADCVADRVTDDLRWLSSQAEQRRIRIGYESLAWSTVTTTLPQAWQCVLEVDRANLGVVVDSFHIFVHGRDAADLDGIAVDRIFAVQLSDFVSTVEPEFVVETARHHRLLPGEGNFPIDTIVDRLLADGYAGPIGLEVFNDKMKAADPYEIARRAMHALRDIVHSGSSNIPPASPLIRATQRGLGSQAA